MSATFVLRSSSFTEGDTIPARHTCDGEDISPPLEWDGALAAQGFVLIVDDPDAPGGTFTHWVLFDIIGSQRELPEGLANVGALGTPGINDFSRIGYSGPCPPRGAPHRYFFTLFALDIATLNLSPGAARRDVEAAIQGHIIGSAQLMGQYARR